MLWEENYLAHYGIKGMKWGVVRWKDSLMNRFGSSRQTPVNTGNMVRSQVSGAVSSAGRTNSGNYYSRAYSNVQRAAESTKAQLKGIQNTIKASLSKEERLGPEDTTGQFGRGNIDLNNRQVVRNRDGTISTEKSFSVNIDGKEVLLPTVINGQIVDEDAAIDWYYQTGEHLGKFDTVEDAEEYAEKLHNRQDWYYNEYQKKNKKTNSIVDKIKSLFN